MPADAARILAALPQTQCTRCGYPDCAGYAVAIANGLASINQCPPGGAAGIQRLAAITGQAVAGLNPENGVESPRVSAFIDEDWCIGCTLCIDACPTDAIVGSHKLMHTVIEPFCTGCELCIPVCPVDCIVLENVSGSATGWAAWSQDLADRARLRHDFSSHRKDAKRIRDDRQPEKRDQGEPSHSAIRSTLTGPGLPNKKRAVIEAALARARSMGGSGEPVK